MLSSATWRFKTPDAASRNICFIPQLMTTVSVTSVSKCCYQQVSSWLTDLPIVMATWAVEKTQSDSQKERRACCVSCSKTVFLLVIWTHLIKTMESHETILWGYISAQSYILNNFSQLVFFHTLIRAPAFHSVSLSKESALDIIHYKVNLPPFTSWETEKTREARNWEDKTELSGCSITFFLYVLNKEVPKLLDSFWISQ